MLTALAALFILQQPLLSAAEPAGPSEACGEAGRRFSQGLVNSWLGYKLRCSFNQILSVLGVKKKKKKGADFKFTLGFKIYYVFQLSSLHNWNFFPLIIFYQHSSTTGGLTSKIALQGWGLLRAACFYCFPHQLFLFSALIRFPSHIPSLTSHLPLALTYVFIPLISLFKMCVKALDWVPRDLSSIPGFSAFSIHDLESECFVLSL